MSLTFYHWKFLTSNFSAPDYTQLIFSIRSLTSGYCEVVVYDLCLNQLDVEGGGINILQIDALCFHCLFSTVLFRICFVLILVFSSSSTQEDLFDAAKTAFIIVLIKCSIVTKHFRLNLKETRMTNKNNSSGTQGQNWANVANYSWFHQWLLWSEGFKKASALKSLSNCSLNMLAFTKLSAKLSSKTCQWVLKIWLIGFSEDTDVVAACEHTTGSVSHRYHQMIYLTLRECFILFFMSYGVNFLILDSSIIYERVCLSVCA